MSSYIVSGLAPRQLKALRDEGVSFLPWGEGTDIFIDSHSRVPLLAALEAAVESESPTRYADVLSLKLKYFPAKRILTETGYSITFAPDWNGNNPISVSDAVEEHLIPRVDKNVVIHVPHGVTESPHEDGDFHLIIWSSPFGKLSTKPPDYLFNTKVDCRDSAFLPSGRGIQVADPESDYVAAELVGNNLYIHHDIVHYGTASEITLLKKIFEVTAYESSLPAERRQERQRQLLEQRTAAAREQYIRVCGQRVKGQIEKGEKELRSNRLELEQAAGKFFQTARNNLAMEFFRQKRAEQSNEGYLIETIDKQMDTIRCLRQVKTVELHGDCLVVNTKTLFATDKRSSQRYDIGEFMLIVSLSTNGVPLRVINSTRRVDGGFAGMNAPYVLANGLPNAQEITETFAELVAHFEIETAVKLSIQLIETVDSSDPLGKYIDRWPLAFN